MCLAKKKEKKKKKKMESEVVNNRGATDGSVVTESSQLHPRLAEAGTG